LKLRYHEFVHSIRNNNPPSAYAMHILNHQHRFGLFKTLWT